ncbi:MAG: hypothetical protein IIA35_08645, partial [Proteobacteria bacterium]|nr:hypothetical protein [Pseudomonadota bacterium]
PGSLGPDPGLRSRGELPLEALDHAEASAAAAAMMAVEPDSYRSFNMVVADAGEAFWLCSRGGGEAVHMAPVPEGLSMLTAHDLNDTTSPRIRHFLPLFEAAPPPDPETGDWSPWPALMGSRGKEGESEEAMTFATDAIGQGGVFGTVSSSLLALPDPARPARDQAPMAVRPRPPRQDALRGGGDVSVNALPGRRIALFCPRSPAISVFLPPKPQAHALRGP